MEKISSATTQPTSNDLYARLSHLFIELRGRGVSLSSLDLETLASWQQSAIDPEFIAKIMCEMANESIEDGNHFPNNLAPIARRLKRELRQKG